MRARAKCLLMFVTERMQGEPRRGGAARGPAAGGGAARGRAAHLLHAHARRGGRHRLSAAPPGLYSTHPTILNGGRTLSFTYLCNRRWVGYCATTLLTADVTCIN